MRYRAVALAVLLVGLFLVTSPLHVCHGCGGRPTMTLAVQQADSPRSNASATSYESLSPEARQAFDRARRTDEVTLYRPWDTGAIRTFRNVSRVRYEGRIYRVEATGVLYEGFFPFLWPRLVTVVGALITTLGGLWSLSPRRYPLGPGRALAFPAAVVVVVAGFEWYLDALKNSPPVLELWWRVVLWAGPPAVFLLLVSFAAAVRRRRWGIAGIALGAVVLPDIAVLGTALLTDRGLLLLFLVPIHVLYVPPVLLLAGLGYALTPPVGGDAADDGATAPADWWRI